MPTYHHLLAEPDAIHPASFVGTADPAATPANNVLANKLWLDTTGGKFVLKKRNVGNTGWDIVLSLKHSDLTDTTTGDPHTQYLTRAIGTTKGDILVYDGAAWQRLPAGTDGYLLRADSAQPDGLAWATPASITGAHVVQAAGVDQTQEQKLNFIGFTVADNVGNLSTDITNPALVNPMAALDDIIIGGASGAATRLAKGTDGQVLTVDPTTHHLTWDTPTTNPLTTQDDIFVGGVAGVPTRLAKGTDGQVLTVDPVTHHLAWDTPATYLTSPMTTQDDIIIGGVAGAAARLAKGSNGQVLAVDAVTGHLVWVTLVTNAGTVTSVGLTMPADFSVAGSPVTASGTLAVTRATQAANVVQAGPSSGGAATPGYRALVGADLPTNAKRVSLAVQLGDGTNAITTGEREQWLEVNFDGTIEGWSLLADASGSIVVDVWKAAYASYPPTVANTITASALPTLSSAAKNQDSTLTGWTTAIARGDVLRFHVNSAATVKAVTLTLRIVKS